MVWIICDFDKYSNTYTLCVGWRKLLNMNAPEIMNFTYEMPMMNRRRTLRRLERRAGHSDATQVGLRHSIVLTDAEVHAGAHFRARTTPGLEQDAEGR